MVRQIMVGLAAGVASFGAMVWFLRAVMKVAGEWITTTVPASAHVYSLVAGLVQMLLVAVLIALLLPQPHGTNATHLSEGDADMALEAKAR
jgi:hypothetical protein